MSPRVLGFQVGDIGPGPGDDFHSLEAIDSMIRGSVSPEFRVDLEHYVSVLGGKFNICNRDRCIDTSVTLGHGGVPVDHAVLEG